MDFKVHLLIYICVLMHVMDSIEGVNDHAHESRPENVRLLGIEPDLKHDMLVGMDRLKPEDDEPSTTYSNSGHRSKSSEGAYPKGIYRLIVLPSKLQSIKENEYHTSFPVVKFKYLRTSINEERDILKSTNEFLRPEGMTIYKRTLNLDRNLTPIRRSTSMIGYLGDRSKVEQQLTMATSLVSEEDSIPGSLVDKSYPSQMRRDYLASLLRRIVASKYNHRDQALVVGGSKSGYSVPGREKILDSDKHLQVVPQKKVISLSGRGDISNLEVVPQKKGISLSGRGDISNLEVVPQKKVISLSGRGDISNLEVVPQKKVTGLSGILSKSDGISNLLLRKQQENPHRSFDGILNLETVRLKRSLERNPGLLGDVNVSVNKGRTRRASIDLTGLLPPIKLDIGRSVPKTDNSESTEDQDENDKRSARMNSVNKGRTRRASIDLTELLPPIELEIGRSAPKSDNSESTEDGDSGDDERSARMKMGKTRTRRSVENRKMSRLLGSGDVTVNKGRSKRASIDLSDLLPPMSLKIGKSASNSGSAKSRSKRASADLSGLLPPVDLHVGKSERSIPDSPQNRESVDLTGLLPPVDLHVGKSERSVPDSPQNRASVDLSGLLPSANLQVGKSERSISNLRQNPLAPALILYSDTKMDRDVPYLQDMLRYFMKKLAKCDDDLIDEDSDLTKQTSKINLDNLLQ